MAVKVFRLDVVPEVSAQLAETLQRLAAASFEHPTIVAVLEAGMEGTTAFLAMEYVPAETLDVGVRRLAPAPLDSAVPILRQVAEALEAAWVEGIGHGALHPRDIFVTGGGDALQTDAVVRVSGFGIAAALETVRIPSSMRRPYTAPEREQGGAWDIRADVYSLGVIAHELLTGQRPAGASDLEVEWPLDTPGEPRRGIRQVLASALARDPGRRFESPLKFVEALSRGEVYEPSVQSTASPRSDQAAVQVQEVSLGERAADSAPSAPEAATEAEVRVDPPVRRPAQTPTPASLREWSSAVTAREEPAMPRVIGPAVMVMLALAAGTAFGYWLRGPVPAAVPAAATVADRPASPAVVTEVPVEEPIGTEVVVSESAGPSPTPTAAPSPTAPPAPATAMRRARTGAPVTGSVLVETRPAGATVSIDGRAAGKAPIRVRELARGSHTVRLSLAGHRTVTTKVVVRAGQQTLVRVSLEIQ